MHFQCGLNSCLFHSSYWTQYWLWIPPTGQISTQAPRRPRKVAQGNRFKTRRRSSRSFVFDAAKQPIGTNSCRLAPLAISNLSFSPASSGHACRLQFLFRSTGRQRPGECRYQWTMGRRYKFEFFLKKEITILLFITLPKDWYTIKYPIARQRFSVSIFKIVISFWTFASPNSKLVVDLWPSLQDSSSEPDEFSPSHTSNSLTSHHVHKKKKHHTCRSSQTRH